MSRKCFHIGVDIDVHAVSCPGVWLCPKGDVMLRISMLGASTNSKRVEPLFPLLFHERFHFQKTVTGVSSLAGLQSEMAKRVALLQLVQWQLHGCRCVVLASFSSYLTDLLYPQPASKHLLAGVDVDLLMEPTQCFPGIIAPKVEVSTKVVVEEMVNYPVDSQDMAVVNRKTLSSKMVVKKSEGKSNKNKMRQKPVCHTRPQVRCYNCKMAVVRNKGRVRCGGGGDSDTLYIPYCNKCGDVVEETEVKQGKIIMKGTAANLAPECTCGELHNNKTACSCSLCRRYDDLFNSSSLFESSMTKLPQKQDPILHVKDKKLGDAERLTVGYDTRPKCPCVTQILPDITKEALSRSEDYRKLLQVDLDAHYKDLYQRVSHRSNGHQN